MFCLYFVGPSHRNSGSPQAKPKTLNTDDRFPFPVLVWKNFSEFTLAPPPILVYFYVLTMFACYIFFSPRIYTIAAKPGGIFLTHNCPPPLNVQPTNNPKLSFRTNSRRQFREWLNCNRPQVAHFHILNLARSWILSGHQAGSNLINVTCGLPLPALVIRLGPTLLIPSTPLLQHNL